MFNSTLELGPIAPQGAAVEWVVFVGGLLVAILLVVALVKFVIHGHTHRKHPYRSDALSNGEADRLSDR